MSFVYLAIPYTSKSSDPQEAEGHRAARMVDFWKGCAYLIDRGDHVVSPMTLEPALIVAPDMPYEWEFWQHYSRKMLGICQSLVVLMLDGWEVSTGVAGEVEEALRLGLPIEYIEPHTVEEWLVKKHAGAGAA